MPKGRAQKLSVPAVKKVPLAPGFLKTGTQCRTLTARVIEHKFIQGGKFLLMKIPSSVVASDFNYLFNPAHKGFSSVKVKVSESFEFDERVFRMW
jgi:RES domain-containing protein